MSTERFAKPLPDFFIGKTETNERVKKFMLEKYPLLNNGIGKDDTKCVWYSLQHIEQLYKELIYMNADGVRVYFGAYPAGHPDFPEQLCLIMVPTAPNILSATHKDIVIQDDEHFDKRPGSENFIESMGENVEIVYKEYNYGSPCPPVCPINGDLIYPY